MKIRVPSKKVCEKFHLTYELKGAQKGVDVLTEYYGVRRMKIVLDGRKVRRGGEAHYFENKAYFTKKGLKKRNVLHELYHHLVCVSDLEMPERLEEKEANSFSRELFED
jgi:hypothetical protein